MVLLCKAVSRVPRARNDFLGPVLAGPFTGAGSSILAGRALMEHATGWDCIARYGVCVIQPIGSEETTRVSDQYAPSIRKPATGLLGRREGG